MKYLYILLLVIFTSCTYKVQAETNTVSSTVSSNTVTSVDKAPPTASAPNLMINQGICQVPGSIGLQSSFVGIATAKGFVDTDCNIRAYSRLLYSYGMKVAAVSLISNSDPGVFDAMWYSQTFAPSPSGKIGIESKDDWSKPENILLIPDGSKVKEMLLKNLEAKKKEENNARETQHKTFDVVAILTFVAILL